MVATFEALSSDEPQTFLHYDRYGITAGRTKPDNSGYEPELRISADERRCALFLPASDFARLSLIPRQGRDAPAAHSGSLELPLGRNIIIDDSTEEEKSQALRDRYRDWEKILVVGDAAVRSFIELTCDPAREPSEGEEKTHRMANNGIIADLAKSLINSRQLADSLKD